MKTYSLLDIFHLELHYSTSNRLTEVIADMIHTMITVPISLDLIIPIKENIVNMVNLMEQI